MCCAMAVLARLPNEDVEVSPVSDLEAPVAGCASSSAVGGMLRSRAMVAWSWCKDSRMLVVQGALCVLFAFCLFETDARIFGRPCETPESIHWSCDVALLFVHVM